MVTNRWRTRVFWGVTVLFAGLMLLSAAMYLAGAVQIRDTLAHLGYPPYILTILGVAKLLGALALLQTWSPTLREWAYAGFTINLIGATASHVLSGDPIGMAMTPAIFLLPLAASYVLQPGKRAGHNAAAATSAVGQDKPSPSAPRAVA